MKAAKYTSEHMKLIDYQAMNAGPKKFRGSPYAQVHWAKYQDNQWGLRPTSLIIQYYQHADAVTMGRQKQYDM